MDLCTLLCWGDWLLSCSTTYENQPSKFEIWLYPQSHNSDLTLFLARNCSAVFFASWSTFHLFEWDFSLGRPTKVEGQVWWANIYSTLIYVPFCGFGSILKSWVLHTLRLFASCFVRQARQASFYCFRSDSHNLPFCCDMNKFSIETIFLV